MTPRRRSDVVTRLLDDELVILDQVGGAVHRLNITASSIWNDCTGEWTTEQITERLAARVGRALDDVVEDVVDTLRNFEQLGLLVKEDSPPLSVASGND